MNSRIAQSGGWARPLLSILAGLMLAAFLMQLSGYDVRAAYGALWSGATGLESGHARGTSQIAIGSLNAHVNLYQLAQSLSRVTPLLLAGLAIALALRAGLFNIGAQGQMTVGALAAAVVGTWGARRQSGREWRIAAVCSCAACAAGGRGCGRIVGGIAGTAESVPGRP